MTFSEAWDAATVTWDDPAVSWAGYRGGALTRIVCTFGAGQTTIVGQVYPLILVMTAYDGLNIPLPGVPITVTAPPAGPSVTFGGADTQTVVTGPVGTAQFVAVANTVAGPVTVTATAAGVADVLIPLTQNADGPVFFERAGGFGQSTEVDQLYPQVFSAQLRDQYGNACAGVTVAFSAPTLPGPSGNWSTGLGWVIAVVSDSQGMARTPAASFRANTSAGAFDVSAVVTGIPLAALLFGCTNQAGPPTLIRAVSGTPQSAVMGAAYPVPFVAAVTDQWGNGADGLAVTFTAPDSAPSGTFANGTATDVAVTGTDGQASASTFTADLDHRHLPAGGHHCHRRRGPVHLHQHAGPRPALRRR